MKKSLEVLKKDFSSRGKTQQTRDYSVWGTGRQMNKEKEERLKDMWNTIKHTNKNIMGVLK